MSVLLSADDLNDFISPGVACIKPVETLPVEDKNLPNPYEVTTEDKLPKAPPPPAQISLTDCLACSGCVTSAETVLVSLQSHAEVQNALDSAPSLFSPAANGEVEDAGESKVFVASVAPQVRASLAATYGTTEEEAGWMVEQLLSGPEGIGQGGEYGNSFALVVDTNAMRDVGLVLGAEEVLDSQFSSSSAKTDEVNGSGGSNSLAPAAQPSKRPILSSACPGWICYAEKTHPHILPHLSALKSPQALTGTLLKTILGKQFSIHPSQIFHLSIMPCFDKKLEASRQELTDASWQSTGPTSLSTKRDAFDAITPRPPVRDVDCVITPRELLMLASSRNISFPDLPRRPAPAAMSISDPTISSFLRPNETTPRRLRKRARLQNPAAGTSGGYLWHTLQTARARHPGSTVVTTPGRNLDVLTYSLLAPSETPNSLADDKASDAPPSPLIPQPLFQAARYYGFRNITNLVRKLQPARPSRLAAAHTSSYTSRTDRPIGKASRPAPPKAGPPRPNGVRARHQPPQSPASATAAPGDNEKSFDYIEVMACPGGCTNGGGQIRVDDLGELQGADRGPKAQDELAERVKAKYFAAADGDSGYSSASSFPSDDDDAMDVDGAGLAKNGAASDRQAADFVVDGVNHGLVHRVLERWVAITGLEAECLVRTSYRAVESDVGKRKAEGGGVAVGKGGGVEAVVGREGGGW